MKKQTLFLIGSLIALAGMLLSFGVGLSEPDNATRLKMKLKKPQKMEERMIAYNNWNYAMRNDGSYMYRATKSEFGGEFPRGTNYGCVYAAGLYVGGKKPGSGGEPDTINVANVEFTSEFLPGKVLIGAHKDMKYRGYKTPNTGSDATRTAPRAELSADNFLSDEYKVYLLDQKLAGYDYDNWPAYAPRTKDDKPLFLSGAAAQTYVVFNDINNRSNPDGNSANIHNPVFGIEVELESFVFTSGLLNNGVFFKMSITNKSQANYHDAYLGLWADPDVGDSYSDDMAGVDTNRGLGVVYSNPAGSDKALTALGLDFLQGPVVDTTEVATRLVNKFYRESTGVYRKILKYDPDESLLSIVDLPDTKFRLGATAFISYPNPTGEPSRNKGDVTRWWYMAGLDMLGNVKANGPYDPTASGNNPGDQRIIHGVGPFILKTGETQDVWFAIAGGRGTINGPGVGGTIYNPLAGSAMSVMQKVDDAMQTAFDNALVSPIPPATPEVHVSVESNRVTLTWDKRSEYTYDRFGDLLGVKKPLFNNNWAGYDFQGYRVYRSLTGFENSWKQVAEFDVIDGIKVENDTLPDGFIIKDVHFGSDAGVQHFYIDTNVINQRTYYYSVTAYDYQPLLRLDGVPSGYPRSLESPLTASSCLRSAVPMAPPAGIIHDGGFVKNLAKATGTYSNLKLDANVLSTKELKTYKSYTIEIFELENLTVNNKRLVGIVPGTLAFRFKDSVSGAYVKFDNYSDDPRTYFDTLPGDNKFAAGTGDSIFDDSYFSTSIAYTDILGNPLPASGVPPILNGISIKLISDTIGVKDFIEIRDSLGVLSTPRSVLYRQSPTGNYDIVIGGAMEIITTTEKIDQAGRLKAARALMNFFKQDQKACTTDYEIRFYGVDTSTVWMSTGPLTNPANYNINSFARRSRVPFTMHKIGYYDDLSATHERLALKSAPLQPTTPAGFFMNNTLGAFDMNGVLKQHAVLSERITLHDTAYFSAGSSFPAALPKKIRAVDFLFRSWRNPTAFPPPGTVIRIEFMRPIQAGNKFIYRQIPNSPESKKLAKNTIKDVRVVPNPYYGRVLEYQSSLFDKKVKFTNLPQTCTIRIFNVAGDLIRTIAHNSTSFNNRVDYEPLNRTKSISTIKEFHTSTEEWDLRNTKGAFVASGMYIALIEAPGVGKTTVKFAIIQEEMRVDGPDNR